MSSRTIADLHPVRCPACGVPLRLRETRIAGATFPCPECREPLVLMSAAEGIELQRVADLAVNKKPAKRRPQVAWRLPTLSPLVFAWSLAGMVAMVLVGAVVRDQMAASRPVRPVAVQQAEAVPPPVTKEPVTSADTPPQAATPPASEASALAESTAQEPPPPVVVESEPPQPPVSAAAVIPAKPAVAARPDPQMLLAQRLVSFQQTKPAPRRALLQTVEDLMDRPVRLDDDVPPEFAARLDAEITVALSNVTVEEFLRAILRDTGLEFECTPEAVQLHGK